MERKTVGADEDSIFMWGDNLPIVDFIKHNIEEKETHLIHTNQILGK